VRRSIALSVILALLLVLLRAPFFHLHAGHEHGAYESGHDRLDLAFHTHVESHPFSADHDGETSVDAPLTLRSVQAINILLLEQPAPYSLTILSEQLAFFSPLVPVDLTIYEPPPRTHDPPFVHSSIPRSPPA
jgi:hypothetical protein